MTDEDTLSASATPRTLLSVAGQTLIEYQARIARACGAGHIVVLVDRMPAALVAAFDRLRADGIDVDIARDAGEAADRIHPEEDLLVIASGVVASRGVMGGLVARAAPTLMTLPDGVDTARLERIDGAERWAGLALLNGKLLRETAAMLGDWTLGPTLLRTALQAGVDRLRQTDGSLALIHNQNEAQSIAHQLAISNVSRGHGFWQTHIVQPLSKFLLPLLIGRNIPLDLVVSLPLVILGAALVMGAMGWNTTSFGVFLLAGFPLSAGKAMANISARPDRALRWAGEAQMPVLLALLAFSGWQLEVGGAGWGAFVLALWAGAALVLQPRSTPRSPWHADTESIGLLMLMASLIDQPLFGLMGSVAYAVITQFEMVRAER